eukprot:3246327-Pleurochrysis_carterae.AAC.3
MLDELELTVYYSGRDVLLWSEMESGHPNSPWRCGARVDLEPQCFVTSRHEVQPGARLQWAAFGDEPSSRRHQR